MTRNDPVVALNLSLIISSFCPQPPDTAVRFSIYSVIAWPVQLEKLNKCWFINEFATLLSLHPAAARHIHPGCSCLIRIFPDTETQRVQREAITESGECHCVSKCPGNWPLAHWEYCTWWWWPDHGQCPGPGGDQVWVLSIVGWFAPIVNIYFVECVFYLMVSGNLRDGPNYLGWEFATSND